MKDENQLLKDLSTELMRVSTERMDISVGELINMYQEEELIIQPDYQRLFRWDEEQQTNLIESLLLTIPIPPIFVAEDELGRWELIDGLQRLSTILSFFGVLRIKERMKHVKNKWELGEGGILSSLEGFNIDDIPMKLKLNLKRSVFRVEILKGKEKNGMKYELFKRLNSGGSKLNPQEMRNAIYRGISTKINDLILILKGNNQFQELVALTPKKKTDLYDEELVLRFIAYHNQISNVNENTEKYLNAFMEKAVRNESFDSDYYINLFNNCFALISELKDEKVFKNSRNNFVPAYYEGILIGLSQNFDTYKNNKELLAKKIEILKTDEKFREYSGSASNSKTRIRYRLTRANEIFAEV